MTTLFDALRARVPASILSSEPDARGAYSLCGHTPLVVATPTSADEVAAVLGAASLAGAAVVPWGGGTRQRLGLPPERVDVALSMARLNRVLEYEPADLTLSVEAGATVSTVNALLASNSQMLPLDPPLPERATIGGTIATGFAGPRRGRYGTARDLTIGIEVARADGTLARAGGRVVKNVAGYDLMKLHVGALGTLGVVTSVNFKVLALPASARALTGRFLDVENALRVLDRLAKSTIVPSAVSLRGDLPAGKRDTALGARLHLLVEGPEVVVADAAGTLEAWMERAGVRPDLHDGPTAAAQFSMTRDFAQTADVDAEEVVVRFLVLPGELPGALGKVSSHAAAERIAGSWQAHADGSIYLRVTGCDRDGARALLAFLEELAGFELNATVLAAGQGVSALPPRWPVPGSGLDLMRAIKHNFDPGRLLNPGRYVGGI